MNLQWFPGHMAKTRRLITENLKLVDLVVELVDARLPLSSRNPEIDAIIQKKPHVLVMNKADIADEAANRRFLTYFKNSGMYAAALDSLSGKGIQQFQTATEKAMAGIFEKDRVKGIRRHAIKMMVVGIPNVGKSSFINRLSGRAAAKTGDRPGITQTKQWIRIAGKYELLDTPGVLWPKFENQDVALRIAFTGGIKDEIMDIEELACALLKFLAEFYPQNLSNRYKMDENFCDVDPYTLLQQIGKKRGCIVSGGEIDTFRAANLLLDDFRSGKIGKITLDRLDEQQ